MPCESSVTTDVWKSPCQKEQLINKSFGANFCGNEKARVTNRIREDCKCCNLQTRKADGVDGTSKTIFLIHSSRKNKPLNTLAIDWHSFTTIVRAPIICGTLAPRLDLFTGLDKRLFILKIQFFHVEHVFMLVTDFQKTNLILINKSAENISKTTM